jgi:hypothetical protein
MNCQGTEFLVLTNELIILPNTLNSAIVSSYFTVELHTVPLRHVVHKVHGPDEADHPLAATTRQHLLRVEESVSRDSKFTKFSKHLCLVKWTNLDEDPVPDPDLASLGYDGHGRVKLGPHMRHVHL